MRTRKSTCVVFARFFSSGEAEYHGLISAVSESLSERCPAADWGTKVGIRILMGATVGAATGSWRGFGRVKHLVTVFLWVHDHVSSGRVRLGKTHHSESPPEILTKPVSGQSVSGMLERLGFRSMNGQSALAYTTKA